MSVFPLTCAGFPRRPAEPSRRSNGTLRGRAQGAVRATVRLSREMTFWVVGLS